jgi:hypothetical protein
MQEYKAKMEVLLKPAPVENNIPKEIVIEEVKEEEEKPPLIQVPKGYQGRVSNTFIYRDKIAKNQDMM